MIETKKRDHMMTNVSSGASANLPSNHIGTLVDVRNTIEEAFNASEPLAHVRLGVVPVVEILGHIVSQKIYLYINYKPL